MSIQQQLGQAAKLIAQADSIWIGAGAGMGVDSGLPDFRGNSGFWNAYPPYRKLGLSFYDLANPRWFREHPQQAWGFYGHRYQLYSRTVPHDGFAVLRRWTAQLAGGRFVFTSNVDGQFQKAGFDAEDVVECHGSIGHLQCAENATHGIWPADDLQLEIDPETTLAEDPLPVCQVCGSVARPNILMFGDAGWSSERTSRQEQQYRRWLNQVDRVVGIEIGAGTAVPSVRNEAERVVDVLIRINPRESQGADIGLSMGAADALREIDALL